MIVVSKSYLLTECRHILENVAAGAFVALHRQGHFVVRSYSAIETEFGVQVSKSTVNVLDDHIASLGSYLSTVPSYRHVIGINFESEIWKCPQVLCDSADGLGGSSMYIAVRNKSEQLHAVLVPEISSCPPEFVGLIDRFYRLVSRSYSMERYHDRTRRVRQMLRIF